MRTSHQSGKTKALREQFWKNTSYLQKKLNIDDETLSMYCNYSRHGVQQSRCLNQLSLDMAIEIAHQLAEPIDDLLYTDYEKKGERE